MDESLRNKLVEAQRAEITEHRVYESLAGREKDPDNREVLRRIGQDELRHYEFWAGYTDRRPAPRKRTVWKYVLIARVLGLTFALKLMERGEERAEQAYAQVARTLPEAADIVEDENQHEQELLALVDEERLHYVGSIVLGLNDALVELTGALAGLTLALRDSRLIAVIGLITGVAAALSMGASEYLSTKAEEEEEEGEAKSPLRAAVYTGVAYIFTVAVLIAPFLMLGDPLAALGLTVTGALLIILAFTYYVAVARDMSFRRRFLEMATVSLGVAAISFGMGYVVRAVFGVDA